MSTNPNSFAPLSVTARRSESGMALIIVLAIIVLLTALIVGFLSRASVDRTASAAYYESNRNAFFTDTAVNIVRSQIDHASTEQEGGRSVAWASQPGMVRSFRPDGTLLRAYKLYSDSSMVTESVDPAQAVTAMNLWWNSPAHFVDLNAPVAGKGTSGARKLLYPIIDNSVLSTYTKQDNGFEVAGAPVQNTDQRIPMPVRWLYVLEDGTTVAPTGNGKTATIPGATRTNPIVGRIAFWTDDESSKLNINTASDGTFWDIPRVSSFEDRDRMARFQPARREFQRYPGHPASVSLRPAFSPSLFASDTAFSEFVFRLAPRLQEGGSERGTQKATGPVLLDSDRLYSSVDDALFSPERTEQLSKEELEKARFFLTARSNSPEVNLFNLPRMAIWPINAGTKTPSTLDRLIAFCSTINGEPYYLQRQNPSLSEADMQSFSGRNKDLWDYIVNLQAQPIPGFGADSFSDKYTSAETRQITTQIFDYIRSSNLYSSALGATPYTGDVNVTPASLISSAKPGTRAGQVTPMVVGDTKGFGRIPTISRAVFQLFISGARTIPATPGGATLTWVPTYVGKVPAYNESSTVYSSWKNFLNNAGAGAKIELLTTGIIYFDTFDPNLGYTIPRYNFDIEVSFNGDWAVVGADSTGNPLVGMTPKALSFPGSTLKINLDHNMIYNAKDNNTSWTFFPRILGGVLGPQWMMQNYSFMRGNPANTITATKDGINYGNIINKKTGGYPLVSDRVAVHLPITLVNTGTPSAPVMTLPENSALQVTAGELTPRINFTGGTMDVRIVAGGSGGTGGEVVQTYNFNFPGFSKPAPTYADNQSTSPRTGVALDKDKQFPISADFRNRLIWSYHHHGFFSATSGANYNTADLRLVQDGDVAVSIVPVHGDKRLLAAKSSLSVGGGEFRLHEFYHDENRRAAVDFRFDTLNRQVIYGMTPGSGNSKPGRILNINYGANALPDMPGHLSNGVSVGFTPDFDNGVFYNPDDAYINRADEGSVTDRVTGTGSSASGGVREVAWYYDYVVEDYADSHDRDEFYSPSRQMPSAGMFGSLPTGVKRDLPWQTLLFRPDPGNHPGARNPPDYALLDFFWMPVVEPYAVSEPFSTNGKVNMNFQMMPFSYIYRATGLHGVLKSEEMLAIPNSTVGSGASTATGVLPNDEYKMFDADKLNVFSSANYRRKLSIPETLKGFEERFNAGNVFFSETQICSLPMIPAGETWSANFESWWSGYRATGDNSRERIYTSLLPKLTTKSNTYTVHYWAQSLRKAQAKSDTEAATWDEDKDRVTAETRGSRMIERYIDPHDTRVPDYAATRALTPSLGEFYRWRVVNNREFAP